MPDAKPYKSVYTVERTRDGDWFVTRIFVIGGQLWVGNESKLYLDFYGRNTSFAQLVPIEALPSARSAQVPVGSFHLSSRRS